MLELALTIKELAPSYNINVVLTRQDQNFPAGSNNRVDGLKRRLAMAEELDAALFISLHMNSNLTNSAAKGMEVYVSAKKKDIETNRLANALIQQLAKNYKVKEIIQ